MLRTAFFTLIYLLTAGSLVAQDIRSNTEGFTISLGGGINHWSSSYFQNLDEEEPIGLGGGLRLGYGLNQRFELFARYDLHTFKLQNDWETYRVSSLGAGVRVNFGGTLQKVRPHLELGFTNVGLSIDPVLFNRNLVEYKLKGPALALGGGLHYFITPNLGILANVTGTFGKFNSFRVNGEGIQDRPDVNTLRFSLGVSYYFHQ